jgi:hypothetical protein
LYIGTVASGEDHHCTLQYINTAILGLASCSCKLLLALFVPESFAQQVVTGLPNTAPYWLLFPTIAPHRSASEQQQPKDYFWYVGLDLCATAAKDPGHDG